MDSGFPSLSASVHPATWRVLLDTQRREKMLQTRVEPESVRALIIFTINKYEQQFNRFFAFIMVTQSITNLSLPGDVRIVRLLP